MEVSKTNNRNDLIDIAGEDKLQQANHSQVCNNVKVQRLIAAW